MKRGIALLLAAVCLLLAGCAPQHDKEASEEGKTIIYTSFFPVYDLVNAVADGAAEVRSFMPLDKDPHLWEPTPKDLARLSGADLLVVNGANLERWLDQVKHNLPDLPVLVLSDFVELITYKGAAAMGDFQYMAQAELKAATYTIDFGHTHEDIMRVAFIRNDKGLDTKALIAKAKRIMENKGPLVAQRETIQVESGQVYNLEMGHERGAIHLQIPQEGSWVFVSDRVSERMLPYELLDIDGSLLERQELLSGSTSGLDKITYDPHSWMSPVNAKLYLNAIQDRLTEMMPEHKRSFRRNKLSLVDALTTLQYDYLEKFKVVENKHFVVTHYAYAYLARDFGLFQFPLQGLISTESPSLKTIRKAIEVCDSYHIDTIFYEDGREQKSAQSLAEEIGGQAMPLVSMEYVPPRRQGAGKGYVDFISDNLKAIHASLQRSEAVRQQLAQHEQESPERKKPTP